MNSSTCLRHCDGILCMKFKIINSWSLWATTSRMRIRSALSGHPYQSAREMNDGWNFENEDAVTSTKLNLKWQQTLLNWKTSVWLVTRSNKNQFDWSSDRLLPYASLCKARKSFTLFLLPLSPSSFRIEQNCKMRTAVDEGGTLTPGDVATANSGSKPPQEVTSVSESWETKWIKLIT